MTKGSSSPPLRVVKLGGRMIAADGSIDGAVAWITALARTGPLVIVHGGGGEVDDLLARLSIPFEKRGGQRVTTPVALPHLAGALAGTINLRLVSALVARGLAAVGLTGVSHECVVARLAGEPAGSLGRVGEPERCDVSFLRAILDQGWVPVFASIASDGGPGYLNVNADLFASFVAGQLGAELLNLTDVPGIVGSDGQLIHRLDASRIPELVAQGVIHGGMIPKAQAAEKALREGVPSVWIGTLSGRSRDGLSAGTWVRPPLPSRGETPSLPVPASIIEGGR
jgi:acetylglutamate kinase